MHDSFDNRLKEIENDNKALAREVARISLLLLKSGLDDTLIKKVKKVVDSTVRPSQGAVANQKGNQPCPSQTPNKTGK